MVSGGGAREVEHASDAAQGSLSLLVDPAVRSGSVPSITRVLWLIKGLGPGGAERLLVNLASAHDRERFGFEAAYLLPWKAALVPELQAAGVPVHCLDAVDPRHPAWLGRLRRLIGSGGFDIVHSHSPLVAGAARLVVRSLAPARRPLLVSTEHNAWSTFAMPTRVLNGLTATLDDATLAVSEETRSSMWPSALRRRTAVVLHGVPLESIAAARRHRDATRHDLGVRKPGELLVVTVANYRTQKSYPDLLRAAREVLAAHPSVRFAAVGQGPLEEEIRALHADLCLGDRFLLLGHRGDVYRILTAADVFVLASAYEGYGVALMEAMAAGLPVVATAVGGALQAVRDGVEGYLVPPGRPAELAGALLGLLNDRTRMESMAASSAERAAMFDIANAARRIEDVYTNVSRTPI